MWKILVVLSLNCHNICSTFKWPNSRLLYWSLVIKTGFISLSTHLFSAETEKEMNKKESWRLFIIYFLSLSLSLSYIFGVEVVVMFVMESDDGNDSYGLLACVTSFSCYIVVSLHDLRLAISAVCILISTCALMIWTSYLLHLCFFPSEKKNY